MNIMNLQTEYERNQFERIIRNGEKWQHFNKGTFIKDEKQKFTI